MAQKARQRLGVDAPLVSEYEIISQEIFRNDPTISICSYVKRKKTWQKRADGTDEWVDVVEKEWVLNPEKYDLKWMKIRRETSLVR